MPFPLPPEVVNYHLLLLLPADDILSLSECIPLQISREVYNSAFHDNTSFDHYDLDMFRQRAKARLYFVDEPDAWGRTTGPIRPEFPATIHGQEPKIDWLDTPFELDQGGHVIEQVCGGSGTAYIRNTKGEIVMAELPDEDEEKGLTVTKLSARREWGDSFWDRFSKGTKSPTTTKEGRFFNSMFAESRFVMMGADDSLCALDSDGLLWYWNPAVNKNQAVPVLLEDSEGRPIKGAVQRIRMSRGVVLCQIRGLGIVQWQKFRENELRIKGCRNGYPCTDGHFWYAKTTLFPDTAHEVKDFAYISRILVCLKDDGRITAWSCEKKALLNVDEVNEEGPFVLLASSDAKQALINEEGRAVMLRWDEYEFETAYDIANTMDVDDLDAAAASACYTHDNVLAQDHQVYTRSYYGCAKLKLPGKAYATFAHIKYSAMLVTEED